MIRPLKSQVLCEMLPVEKKTPSGIIIPDTVQGRPNRALVVACGPDIPMGEPDPIPDDEPEAFPDVMAGDIVIINAYAIRAVIGKEYAATPLAMPGDLFLIDYNDILGEEV